MGSSLINILHVLLEKAAQVMLAEKGPVSQKLFMHGTVLPLDKGLAVGHSWRSGVQRDVS
jgi:hypothetical protein